MAKPKLNNLIRWLALIVLLGVVVYIAVLSTTDDGAGLIQKISQLSLNNLIAPIGLSLMSYLFRFVRWRLILKQLGHKLPLKSDCLYYLSGFALTMTPGKSGETIRSAFLLQAKVPVQTSLSAFVIERSFDLLVVGLLATLLFIPALVTLLLFLSALAIICFIGAQLAKKRWLGFNVSLPKIALHMLDMVSHASIALKPKCVLAYALLGCAAWGAQGLGFYYIVHLFTQDVYMLRAISTYCAGLFVGAASLIPGGIGVTEGSLSWLLQTQGLDQNSAILSALISRGCTLWLAVAIGCCALTAIIRGQTISK
ncbi:MAG TPA: lysylphosphatidylglycerol synthase transmembrane domain-containing protein [Cellvibrionaceae bacterium]